MAGNLGDLMVRVGADIGGFKDAFKDAITLLESAGEKANRAGSAIAKAFDKLGVSDASAKVAAQAKSLQASFELLEKAYKDGRISAEDFTKAQSGLRTELEKLAKVDFTSSLDKMQDRLGSLSTKLRDVGSLLTVGLTAPIVGFGAAAIKSASDMQSLEIGLKAVTKEAGPLEVQLNRLKEVAKLPGLGFKEAVQGSINLQAAGISAQTAERGLKAFGNALATVGKGRAELEGVNFALSQIATKPKVMAQEINQLAERLPQIRQAMLDAFGTADTEVLQKMGLSTKEFIEKIITEFEKLPKATGGFKNEMENLRDATDQALAAIGKALIPFATSILSALQPVIKFLQEMGESFAALPAPAQGLVIAITGIAAAAGPALYAIGGMATGLKEITPLLGKLATAGAPAGQALGAVSASAGLLAGGLVTLAAAIAGVTLFEAFKGASEIAELLDEVAQKSKGAKDGLTGLGEKTQETATSFSTFAKVLSDVGEAAAHLAWEALWPPAQVESGWRNLYEWISRTTNTLPGLENAARKAQVAVNDIARAQAQAAIAGTTAEAKDLAKKYEEERIANLRALEVAEKYLKMVKDTKGSKDQLDDAERKVTEAQRRLNPEFKAAGDAAGSYGKKLDETKQKARSFNAFQLEHITKLNQAREKLLFATEAEKYFPLEIRPEVNEDLTKLIAGVEKAQAKIRSLTPDAKELENVLDHLFRKETVDEYGDALDRLGTGNFADLNRQATQAWRDLETLRSQSITSTEVLLRAEETALQKQIAAAKASGKSWSEYAHQLENVRLEMERLDIVGQMGGPNRVKNLQLEIAELENLREQLKQNGESWAHIDRQIEQVDIKLEKLGRNKGLDDLSAATLRFFENFEDQVGKSLDGLGDAFVDALFGGDIGPALTKLWTDFKSSMVGALKDAIRDAIITPITDALKAGLSDLITGLTKKLRQGITDAIVGAFGGSAVGAATEAATGAAGQAAGAAGGVAGAGGGAAGGLGSISGLAGGINLASGVATAVSSVISNFQFRAMNKSLDIIVKHTLQTANDLANLRSDSWLREDHLMVKLDDLWRTLLDTKDFLGTILLGAVESIHDAILASSSVVRQVGDQMVEVPIPVLERIIDAINDSATRIVDAIKQYGGVGGGGGAEAGAPAAPGEDPRIREVEFQIRDALEQQSEILSKLPDWIQSMVKTGTSAETILGIYSGPAVDAITDLINNFYNLNGTIQQLQTDLANLKRGTGSTRPATVTRQLSGALNPETMQVTPSEATPVIATGTVGGSVDMTGVIEALGGLYQMLETKFDALLKVFGIDGLKGIEQKMQGTTGAVDQTTEATKQTTLAVDDTTSAVMESARVSAAATGDLGSVLGSAIRELPAAVGSSVANATATSLIEGSLRESIGGQPFDYAALRMPAIPEFNPDSARPRTAFEVNNAYNRPIVNYNITGNTFRNRDDIDYFVDQLNSVGVR